MDTLGLVIVDQRAVVLATVVAAFGLVLLVGGWAGFGPTSFVHSAGPASKSSELAIRTAAALFGAIGIYAFTQWPVAGIFGGVAGWFALTVRNAKRERREAIDRVDAIAVWVENIRDNISAAAGLQQALRMSADHAPAPIRPEVRDMVLRMQHESVTTALRRFAADVAHPTSDMVVACLILASSRAAGSLASVLARTAQAARDSAAMRRQIEAGRSATLSQAKLVAIVTALVSAATVAANRDFVSPFDSSGGQVALFVVLSMFAGSAVLLYRMSRPVPEERVFQGVEDGIVAASGTGANELAWTEQRS